MANTSYERRDAAAVLTITRSRAPQRGRRGDRSRAARRLRPFRRGRRGARPGRDGRGPRGFLRRSRPEGGCRARRRVHRGRPCGRRGRVARADARRPDGVHAPYLAQAHDRRDLGLRARRRARGGVVVRPADRDDDSPARIPGATLGGPADRRRDAAASARRRDGARARADPHRTDHRGGRGARLGAPERGRAPRVRTSTGRSRSRRGSPPSRSRRCSPTASPRSRAPACRWTRRSSSRRGSGASR